MSRLTSAQVISLGDYLEPDFDPASLTVSQLLGVLGYHNIAYPTPYTKPKLIQVFNNEVKTRAKKFKKERIKKENSIASEEGITDGITGQPLAGRSKLPAPVARRTSRRLSQIPKDEDSSPTRPEPPKRRRSSAQPVLGGSSKRVAQSQVTLIEESEPEEEQPVRKVGRTKKLTSPGVQGRRVSHVSGGEDSGWEDNNIFQSGAEDSSPARPSPIRPRASRASGIPRKTRKSTSAPPQPLDSPLRPTNLPDHIPRSPPQSPFRPSLPPIPTFGRTQPEKVRFTPVREFSPAEHTKPEHPQALQRAPEVEQHDNVDESPKDSDSQIDEAISRIMSEEMHDVDVYPSAEPSAPVNRLARGVVWALIFASLFGIYSYKSESASIGFCERGSNTSQALDNILFDRAAKEACQRRNSLLQNSSQPHEELAKGYEDCGLPPLVPIPHPSSCTSCPDHASCSQFEVTCDSGYLLKPHILLSFIPVSPSRSSLTTSYVPQLSEGFFKAVSIATDGFPGFGSVGLPPRCVEDPQRRRHIGAMGKSIESRLAKERGKRVCRGDHTTPVSDSQAQLDEAVKWGVEENQLREFYRKTASPKVLPQFDEMFDKAIQQLTEWGGVFIGQDADGKRYIANKTPEMSWQCIVAVKSRETWAVWRTTVIASVVSILAILGGRLRLTQKQKENRRIAGLVQVALDTLRNQEMAHYTDPISAPQPYLSSIQLRDLVLQEEHSVPTRRRLWERVERVVESNANVRANLEEIEGGDETRVWRWVGSTGRTPGRRGVHEVEAGG
uniref:Man1/Src1 C-terminal domain-containing protein n=1 Tax=Psilocybe cubensis TaxID=181762 RepID=A0A8H7Y3D3_PSICU